MSKTKEYYKNKNFIKNTPFKLDIKDPIKHPRQRFLKK